jgi:cell division protein FtsN
VKQQTQNRTTTAVARPGRAPSTGHGAARQRGGFAVGLIVGLLLGLGVALGVALYVTKVPIPFVNKVQQRSAGQDAAESEKNRNWDPNTPLYGKNPARPSASTVGSGRVTAAPAPAALPAPGAPSAAAPSVRAAASAPARGASVAITRDPAALPGERAAPRVASASAPPSPALAAGADPFSYFVQAGAYGRTEDADQQRARLAILGLEGRITEREQSGRTVYRVRVGPFDKKADADSAREKLADSGVEAQLVRVQR